jgi:NADP-reducing hydrogenase subunit HndB
VIEFDLLKKVDIFKGLDKEQLASIRWGGKEKTYLYADRLLAEGQDANCVWIVIAGQVDLRFDLPGRPTSEENTIFSITTAQTLGWSSFVPPFKYALSAYCATRSCRILQIDKEYLLTLFTKDVRMGFLFMSNLAGVASTHFHQLQDSASGSPVAMVKIIVHLATCGIAAGAREVMRALVNEMSHSDRQDIQLASSGCMGRCESEPNVTVEITGEEPVIYQKMTPQKIRQVYKKHILDGQVQSEFVLVP